jgi:hypothetical protein
MNPSAAKQQPATRRRAVWILGLLCATGIAVFVQRVGSIPKKPVEIYDAVKAKLEELRLKGRLPNDRDTMNAELDKTKSEWVIRFSDDHQRALSPKQVASVSRKRLTRYEALKLAVAHLRANRSLPKSYRLSGGLEANSNDWVFTFSVLPPMPSGQLIVIVTERGRVEYSPGL